MKKILLISSLFALSLTAFSQTYSSKSTRGNINTLDSAIGAVTSNVGFINKVYADTTAANLDLHLKYYTGAQIFSLLDSAIFVRNNNHTAWVKAGSGSGGGGCLVTYHVTPDSLYLVKDSCGSIVDSTQWVGGSSGGGNNDAYNNVEQGFDSTFFILKRANGTQDTVVINNTGSGGSDNLQTYTSGSSVTVTNGVNILLINPSTLQSSLTITLPAIPSVRNDIEIYFGGTIAAGSDVVTTITIVGNTGQALYELLVPTTMGSGEYLSYKWIPSLNRWYAKR